MNDVTITTTGGQTVAETPYNTAWSAGAKRIGGRWDPDRKAWTFDARNEKRARALARRIYGTDGDPAELADIVTVRVHVARHEVNRWEQGAYAEFAGRRIATRRGRNAPVHLPVGVVLVAGEFPDRGGSMRYPAIGAADDVVVEIRDLPRAALAVESESSYEIVDEATS